MWNPALAIVGAAMARQISPDNVWARFMGYCLAGAYAISFSLTLTMFTGNIGGFAKNTTINVMIFDGYCVGNDAGPHLFSLREAPLCPFGFLSIVFRYKIA
ncbi:hypothetical protein KAF25_011004 [Fusarium avenaceum]|uniref:Uncharacterized protein n=1 Tax=Fusarium avenaceum TaxID=40199 RepID=A0A9P7KLS9_9HYPO|nr:hypothetical protein KAF25_011004 [Fusarium avenaceum]